MTPTSQLFREELPDGRELHVADVEPWRSVSRRACRMAAMAALKTAGVVDDEAPHVQLGSVGEMAVALVGDANLLIGLMLVSEQFDEGFVLRPPSAAEDRRLTNFSLFGPASMR